MKTRKLVEGAIIAAIYAVFLVINLYTAGVLEYMIYLVMPIPFVVYGYKYGWKYNLMLVFTTSVITIFVSLPTTLIYMITANAVGLAIGHGLNKGWSTRNIFLAIIVICGIFNILTMTIFSALFDIDLLRDAKEIYNLCSELLASINININVSLDQIVTLMIPISILTILMESYFMMFVSLLFANRIGLKVTMKFNIFYLRLPKWVAFIAILCIIYAPFTQMDLSITSILFQFVYYSGLIALIVEGIIAISFVSIVKGHRWLPMLVAITAFIPFVNYFHCICGIIDIFSDFRTKLLYNNRTY